MEELQREIETLKKQMAELSNSALIPFAVEQAFKDRLSPPSIYGEGAASTQDISLSGNAETITVPSSNKTLKVKYKEKTYELLCK